MDKEEVISRLCGVVTAVGTGVFKNKESHDCFCDSAVIPYPVVSPDIIEFIEDAITEAIHKHNNP